MLPSPQLTTGRSQAPLQSSCACSDRCGKSHTPRCARCSVLPSISHQLTQAKQAAGASSSAALCGKPGEGREDAAMKPQDMSWNVQGAVGRGLYFYVLDCKGFICKSRTFTKKDNIFAVCKSESQNAFIHSIGKVWNKACLS